MPKGSVEDKKEILVRIKNCKECLSCMYECSMKAFGCFSLVKSRIQVMPGQPPYKNSSMMRTITFSNDCEHCYRCVKTCSHNALYLESGVEL
jgi:Fe-S-cluster-containing dehydrogenase component